VWAVAKGSFKNKAILVPTALIISAFANWAITPLLMIGGAYLCYEGFEKLAHKYLAGGDENDAHRRELIEALANPAVDLVALEKEKIKGAIRTDFILSAEIIVIALGTVAAAEFVTQVTVLIGIAILMTVGVYGLVAGIVKLDDAGLYLSKRAGDSGVKRFERAFGRGLLWTAPYLMKLLSIAGTAAMFLVGGGILTHGIPGLQQLIAETSLAIGALAGTLSVFADGVFGIAVGALVLGAVTIGTKMFGQTKHV
jgi:predicted DNA repair protein MutK